MLITVGYGCISTGIYFAVAVKFLIFSHFHFQNVHIFIQMGETALRLIAQSFQQLVTW